MVIWLFDFQWTIGLLDFYKIIYQRATNLHYWQQGSRTVYKKKLHYWAAVAKYDYKDKQWVMDKQAIDFKMHVQCKPVTIICNT